MLAEAAEYRLMAADGFQATFVDKDDPAQIERAIAQLLDHPECFATMRSKNRCYLEDNEDGDRQMERLLAEIETVVNRSRNSSDLRQHDSRRPE